MTLFFRKSVKQFRRRSPETGRGIIIRIIKAIWGSLYVAAYAGDQIRIMQVIWGSLHVAAYAGDLIIINIFWIAK